MATGAEDTEPQGVALSVVTEYSRLTAKRKGPFIMRRYAVRLALLILLTLNVGCSSTWAQQFRDNPVLALQNNVQYLSTALSLARGAVAVYSAASGDASALSRFESVAGNVSQGIVVAQDGLRLAANVGSRPDVPALLRDATTAMRDVHAFLEGLPSQPGRAPDPIMRDALAATAQAAGLSASGS